MTDDDIKALRAAIADPALQDTDASPFDTWRAVLALFKECHHERITRLLDEVERLRAELAEAKRPVQCDCDMRTRLVGDGCDKCNPALALEYANQTIADLESELAEATRDAERYRWLRGDSCPDHSARWTQWEVRLWRAPFWTGDLRRDDLDAAVDAAIRTEAVLSEVWTPKETT